MYTTFTSFDSLYFFNVSTAQFDSHRLQSVVPPINFKGPLSVVKEHKPNLWLSFSKIELIFSQTTSKMAK